MRRINREINIFSLSAIDLFCSAMGAFMVISIVLFPYFRKKEPVPENRPSQQELAQAEQRSKQLQAHNDALQKEIKDLKAQVKDASVLALFGIVTKANSIVLLVDLSGSISGQNSDKRDFRAGIQKTCNTIIDGMKSDQKLQIIGFHTPNGAQVSLPMWQGAPVPLSPQAKTEARAFVSSILSKADGGTPTGDALRAALSQSAEAVFLLTDGAPTDTRPPRKELCDSVLRETTALNKGKMEIHSIAIGDYNSQPFLMDFLMDLAKRNRGQFLGMPDA